MKKTLLSIAIAIHAAALSGPAAAQTPEAAPTPAENAINQPSSLSVELAAGVATAPPEQPPADGVTPRADAPRLPVSTSDSNFFLRQAMLQREIRLLELQARRKELQDEIAGKDESESTGAVTPGGPIVPVAATPAPIFPSAPVGPPPPPPMPFVLLSIYGGEGVYKADFAVGAARVSVSRGAELPGGWTVQSIGPFDVVVKRGRQEKTLRLGS